MEKDTLDEDDQGDLPPPRKVSRMTSDTQSSSSSGTGELRLKSAKGASPAVVKSTISNCREAFFCDGDVVDGGLTRRFPGPAGWSTARYRPVEGSKSKDPSSKVLSDEDVRIMNMNRDPWRVMVQHLGLSDNGPKGLLKLMNVQWIKQKAIKQSPRCFTIPLVALVVMEGSGSSSSTNGKLELTFMDATDNIKGAVDASFNSTYGSELVPGTAIAIRNASVMYDYNMRRMILPITEKNIVCLVSLATNNKTSSVQQTSVPRDTLTSQPEMQANFEELWHTTEKGSSVRILNFMSISIDCIMKEYKELIESVENRLTVGEFNEDDDDMLVMASDIVGSDISFNFTPD